MSNFSARFILGLNCTRFSRHLRLVPRRSGAPVLCLGKGEEDQDGAATNQRGRDVVDVSPVEMDRDEPRDEDAATNPSRERGGVKTKVVGKAVSVAALQAWLG